MPNKPTMIKIMPNKPAMIKVMPNKLAMIKVMPNKLAMIKVVRMTVCNNVQLLEFPVDQENTRSA